MVELWLNFEDDKGSRRRVLVDRDEFTIGRTPDNSLSIPDQRLSRSHACIRRFATTFVIADLGSSNGTTLNGKPVTSPVGLSDGDEIDLGGGVVVAAEISTDSPRAAGEPRTASRNATSASNIPMAWLIAVPLLGVIAFVCAGGGFLLLRSSQPKVSTEPTDVAGTDEDEQANIESDEKSASKDGTSSTPSPLASPPPVREASSELKRVEDNAAKFMRNIAANDPAAFLSTKHAEQVLTRVTQLKASPAVTDNIRAAAKASSEIDSLASAQGLKGSFVAAVAVVKMGSTKGDVAGTAKSILPILADLRISLGNSLADDNLLMAADFLRREANRNPSLRITLEAISKSNEVSSVDPRVIRTIWFLKERGKLSNEYFEFAVRVLAVGTIMQNPSDFGINP